MIRDHLLAFDELVPTTAALYSSDAIAERLGRWDQMALHAFVTTMPPDTGSGTLAVAVYRSPDGELWKSEADTITLPYSANQTKNAHGFVTNSLPLVRLRIQLSGALARAHVKVYAVLRDPSD